MGIFKGNAAPAAGEFYISEGSVFEGNINTEGDARVDGQMNGNITAKNGLVSSGPRSVIDGDITAKDLCLGGKVNGDIYATGEFACESTAVVYGNVIAAAVAVDKGAYFKGSVEITSNIAPPLESPEAEEE